MLQINMDDVINILKLCAPYLIFFGVVFVAALITSIAVRKRPKPQKYMIRAQSLVVTVVALVIAVNFILLGPMATIVSLATGNGVISKTSTQRAQTLCENIADEGIVLLKNDNQLLPLNQNKKLNVFGWGSTNPCYGGTGSGSLSHSYPTISLLDGLKNAGITTNQELTKFYTQYRADRPQVNMMSQDWTLPEPPAATYSTKLMEGAKNFSDTAMIVVSRVGGEGADLPTDMSSIHYKDNASTYKDFKKGEHFLQLSQSEKDMVQLVCKNFQKVMLVYNGANTFQLGFVNQYPQIKSVLWCPGTGQSGFNSLGRILTGETNPSGKTSDTFAFDLTKTPYYNNFGNFKYSNMSQFKTQSMGGPATPTFVNYNEGIYVGYRFYETAAQEGLISYDKTVQYPFGYGLSYTNFMQSMGSLQKNADGKISFEVTVTNNGSVGGKEVVEVYFTPPYQNGGTEKASANLIAFKKTKLLKPGESQKIPISFKEEDMASYNMAGKGSYVLDAGKYGISIRSDSHHVLAQQDYTVDRTIPYDQNHRRSTDQTAAVNRFSNIAGHVTYLSRKDHFANYQEATAAPKSLAMPDDEKAQFVNNSNYDSKKENNPSDQMPTTGAKNGMKLESLRGKSYSDPAWEKLLDQMSVKEMNNLIALAGYHTEKAASVDKRSTVDCDGPASINNNFTKVGSIGFPSAVMIASTWNTDLANAFGESIGQMASDMGVSGWYGPAMNTHRSAFGGRNFEYYSEDGLLSGRIAASAIAGAKKHGVYAYMKHFALNDQETNRLNMLCTWTNEQALREIYLKPFEISVKEGGVSAAMVAFNYMGAKWIGASKALMTDVLRKEWGFQGFVLTDYFFKDGYGYMNADQGVRSGVDACLATYNVNTNYVKDTSSATSVLAMRHAAKNMLYTVVNSRQYDAEQVETGLQNWQIALIAADAALAAAVLLLELLVIRKGYQKRKTAQAVGIADTQSEGHTNQ